MGDIRFQAFYDRLVNADRPAEVLRELGDDEIVSALAATCTPKDAYLANVLATEAHNRLEQRARLEQALLESEERYRLLAEHASDLVMSVDENRDLTYTSPSVTRVLGYEPHELTGRPFDDVVHPDDRARVDREWATLMDGAEDGALTLRALHRDGGPVQLAATVRAFDLGTGHVLGAVVVARAADRATA